MKSYKKNIERLLRISATVITTALMIFGCGSKEETISQPKTESISTTAEDETTSIEASEEVENAGIQEDIPTTSILIDKGSKFSDGVAWVKYSIVTDGGEETDSGIGLLNIDGKIIPLSFLDEFGSDFCGGYSYINYKNDERSGYNIIDINGQIITQSEDDTDCKILCGGDGWYLVFKKVRSMEVSEDLYGIIDHKGSWIFEPKTDLMFGYEQGSERMLKGGAEYLYLENGIFHARWKPNNAGRNVSLNVIFDAKRTDNPLMEVPLDFDYESKIEGVYNDSIIWSYSSSYRGSVYRLDGNGQSIKLASSDELEWVNVEYGEGLIYIGTKKGNDARIIDTQGNEIADLRQYQIYGAWITRFQDGYAPVTIKGADNLVYLTIIDASGAFTFEPIKIKDVYGFVDGKVACTLYGESEKINWVDVNGNISDSVVDITPIDIESISYGYIYDKDTYQYVSVMGEYLDVYIEE